MTDDNVRKLASAPSAKKAVAKKAAARTRKAAKPYEIIQPEVVDVGAEQIVSYSELDTFRQCPLKHHLAYQRRWTKKVKPGGALDKGTTWHTVMETHYGVIKLVQDEHKGRVPAKLVKPTLKVAREEAMKHLVHPISGAQTEVQELVEWMYTGYVEQWGIDEQWRIVGIEHQIKQALPKPDGTDSRYILKAKLDMIVREWSSGNLWVWDHKSGANLPYKEELEINDQFGLYTWLMRKIGRKIQGTMHNAARTTRNQADFPGYTGKSRPQLLEQRFARTYLNRSEKELDNLALDAYYAAKAAYPDDPAYAARYSSPDPRTCGWKCDMKEAHLAMRQGQNPDRVMVDLGFVVNRTRH